ncbi:MAG: SAM-dependent chlorinase/fluorinase [Chloroflexota bacterium]
MGIITLTTDFGADDGYVAAMKGVILSINPEARLVDVCHTVPAQAIGQAAYIIATTFPYFPPGTVHLVVVDPGVGTDRRAVILRTPRADFVAPDNGVLTGVLQDFLAASLPADGTSVNLSPPLQAVALTRPEFRREPVSATFHGRDVFAPAAAHLSRGTPLEDFGETLPELTVLPGWRPRREPDGTLAGQVRHIDRFGNIITSVRTTDLPPDYRKISVRIGETTVIGLTRTYGEGRGLMVLPGSSGYLEIAFRDGDAGHHLKAAVGDEVTVKTE